MEDLAGDEHALAGVKGVVDDGVAGLYQLGQAHRPLVEGVLLGDAVGHGVGRLEQSVRRGVPGLLPKGLVDVVLLDLGVLVVVELPDHVGHAASMISKSFFSR